MANTPDLSTCNERKSNAQLPVDPWRSLAVHFGMLLGVDDFRTIGAYHRGKQWLHNGWLHREGVVWGLVPSYDAPSGELRIEPGLAIDPAGRELHLDARACIDLGKWYAKHVAKQGSESEPDAPAAGSPGDVATGTAERPSMVSGRTVAAPAREPGRAVVAPGRLPRPSAGPETIDAHVRIRFVGCATNEVPAMVEPCEGSGRITAYSRVFETVELELVEGLPEKPPLRYPRLRLLFGLEGAAASLEPTEAQEIRDARAHVFNDVDPAQQPARFVGLFRKYAALDAAELAPGESEDGKLRVGEGVLTAVDPAWLTIATIRGLTFEPVIANGEVVSWSVESLAKLIWTDRATHVATWDLEELIAASLACCGPSGSSDPGLGPGEGDVEAPVEPEPEPEPIVESGGTEVAGPRAKLGSFDPVTGSLTLTFDKPVSEPSIKEQLEVFAFSGGWRPLDVTRLELAPDGRSLGARFDRHPNPAAVFRLRFGHNEPPVIGTDGWPLAGAADEPPPLPHHGRAFVHNVGPRSPE